MASEARGHRCFAWFYANLAPRWERAGTAEHRGTLLSRAQGVVIEIGSGTGLNFPHYPSSVVDVIATEPDPHMLKRLRPSAKSAPVHVRVEEASADRLPVGDASADTLVATLVLCSVPDASAALTEARRVLKPGGRLLFFEHVRSREPTFAGKQDRWRRPWGFFAAGCHPNRDTVAAIEAAGFQIEDVQRFDVKGNWLATPHAMGSARKPVDSLA